MICFLVSWLLHPDFVKPFSFNYCAAWWVTAALPFLSFAIAFVSWDQNAWDSKESEVLHKNFVLAIMKVLN
jgi:hypothetical protein